MWYTQDITKGWPVNPRVSHTQRAPCSLSHIWHLPKMTGHEKLGWTTLAQYSWVTTVWFVKDRPQGSYGVMIYPWSITRQSWVKPKGISYKLQLPRCIWGLYHRWLPFNNHGHENPGRALKYLLGRALHTFPGWWILWSEV